MKSPFREALIFLVPWDDAGSYLRFSVTFEAEGAEEEMRVVAEMEGRLAKLELQFNPIQVPLP